MASSFLPILSYDDADVSEAAVASASPPQQAAKTAAAASVEAQPPRRTIAVPPAPPGGRNEAGLDTGVLDSVLRRFRAVDLGAEAGVAAPNAADNPMPAAQKRVVPPGGKPAVKKKAAAPPTPEEAAKAAQLAAEAAARRAAAEAGLRAKQERSSAALSAVEWMLEHTAGSEAELRQRALGPLTAGEFEEAMRERALSGVCGCPLCDAPLTRPADLGKVRVSLRQHKVFRSEAPLFCGDACATRARAVQVTLPEETPLPVYDAKEGAIAPPPPAAAVPPAPAPAATKAPAAAFGAGGAVTMAGSIVEHAAPQPDPGAQPLPGADVALEARAAAAAAVEGFAPRAEARHVQWADGGAAAPQPPPGPGAARPGQRSGPPVDVSSSVSFDMPERLSASYYHAKVERALTAARARGEQAAEEARDTAPPTAAQEVSEETAAAEAFVRGWAEAIDAAPEVPDAAGAPPSSRPAAASAPAAVAPPSAAGSGGATFVFDVMAEGAFGVGVRQNEADPDAPLGSGLTNMGQFSYGELKLIRDDEDDARPTRRQAGDDSDGSDEEGDEDEPLGDLDEVDEADEADDSGAENDDADDVINGQERDADDDDGWAAERYGAPRDDEDYEDDAAFSGDEEYDAAQDAPPAVKGAHPLFEPPTPEMRTTLSPFLSIWTALDSWVTPATLAFLASAPAASAAAQLGPGPHMTPEEAAAAARRAPPLRARESGEVLQALAAGLDRAMPTVCSELGLRVPVSAMDTALQALLRTFAFRGAAPALSAPRWALLLLLLLEPLGRSRLPQLGADLATERAHRGTRALVEAAGFTPDQHAALREPLALVQP